MVNVGESFFPPPVRKVTSEILVDSTSDKKKKTVQLKWISISYRETIQSFYQETLKNERHAVQEGMAP